MSDKLPNFIDPIHSAQHHKRFEARVNQGKFSRLAEQLISADGDVDVSIEFYNDKVLKHFAFNMQLKTILLLECQRTLQAFELPVQTEIKGVFVESLALADELPADVEVYELTDDKLSLYELVEEELLLSVPMIPMSENSMDYQNAEECEPEVAKAEEFETKPNPFAILKGLKSN